MEVIDLKPNVQVLKLGWINLKSRKIDEGDDRFAVGLMLLNWAKKVLLDQQDKKNMWIVYLAAAIGIGVAFYTGQKYQEMYKGTKERNSLERYEILSGNTARGTGRTGRSTGRSTSPIRTPARSQERRRDVGSGDQENLLNPRNLTNTRNDL